MQKRNSSPQPEYDLCRRIVGKWRAIVAGRRDAVGTRPPEEEGRPVMTVRGGGQLVHADPAGPVWRVVSSEEEALSVYTNIIVALAVADPPKMDPQPVIDTASAIRNWLYGHDGLVGSRAAFLDNVERAESVLWGVLSVALPAVGSPVKRAEPAWLRSKEAVEVFLGEVGYLQTWKAPQKPTIEHCRKDLLPPFLNRNAKRGHIECRVLASGDIQYSLAGVISFAKKAKAEKSWPRVDK